MAYFGPEWVVHFGPEKVAHIKPEYMAQFDRNLQIYMNMKINDSSISRVTDHALFDKRITG